MTFRRNITGEPVHRSRRCRAAKVDRAQLQIRGNARERVYLISQRLYTASELRREKYFQPSSFCINIIYSRRRFGISHLYREDYHVPTHGGTRVFRCYPRSPSLLSPLGSRRSARRLTPRSPRRRWGSAPRLNARCGLGEQFVAG